MRAIILNYLRWIPDEVMLKIQYKIKTGRKLNLKNPERFTEKIQWYKINYRNPLMQQCVDKYNVRKYVENKGLQKILVELYEKYNSIDEIEWNKLPNSFVLKTTNGGGGLNVIICHDKSTLDIKEVKKRLTCKKFKSHIGGREWAYYNLEGGIIIEELLINQQNPIAGVNDYKIFCYNGVPKYIIVDVDRYIGHKRNFYDIDWNRIEVVSDCPSTDREIDRPKNLEEMLNIAEKLSEGFPYVRVDLYNINGEIYFGEMTFYPWSGYVQFEPDNVDFILGKEFNIEKTFLEGV